jgi:ribosomal protein S18 acetylase RimI-like enzyme
MGAFERETGLDKTAEEVFRFFHRRSLWTLLALMRVFGRAPFTFFVGVDRGRVLGSAGLVLLPKAGYVIGVVTDSAERNRGIASHVVEDVHRAAVRQGRQWAALDVESDNETAIRVYRRLGYEERMRFDWYVGPIPTALAPQTCQATEARRSKTNDMVAWVSARQPISIREALPANAKMLSHLENVAQLPGSLMKTWSISTSGKTAAVVRGYYIPTIKTVFAIPAAWDSSVLTDGVSCLVAPAVEWAHAMDATRMVAVLPEPPGESEGSLTALGLKKAVATILMVRPLTP